VLDPQRRKQVGAVAIILVLGQLEAMSGRHAPHRASAFEPLVAQLQRLQHQAAVQVGVGIIDVAPLGTAVVDRQRRQFADLQVAALLRRRRHQLGRIPAADGDRIGLFLRSTIESPGENKKFANSEKSKLI